MSGIDEDRGSLRDLLAAVAAGRCPVDDAAARIQSLGVSEVGDYARLDLGRGHRKGVPEVVYARGKSVEQLVEIVTAFVRATGRALCSKVSAEQAEAVRSAGVGRVQYDGRSGVLVVGAEGYRPPEERGVVGIVAAGTSDVPAAEEAAAVCREMGVRVVAEYDVGVAGLHRLAGPLRRIVDEGAAAVIVAAGMEGALPSVVAGLVDVPVIGLPTSTGYGMGGGGEAALLGMLQSCSPGLAVVNIDNGVGAGATAALIARRGAERP